jgi:hypothetical protein
MFYGNTKSEQLRQRPICHYDLLSQIVRLKKTMSKRKLQGGSNMTGTISV